MASDKGIRACHQIRWIGFEIIDCPSPTVPGKRLQFLAPTIRQRKNQGFGYLMTVPKPLVSVDHWGVQSISFSFSDIL